MPPLDWETVEDLPTNPFATQEEQAAAWEQLKQRLPLGRVLTGRVVIRTPFGVFYDAGQQFPVLINVPEFQKPEGYMVFPNDYPALNSEMSGILVAFDDICYQLRVINSSTRLTEAPHIFRP